jgi:hypothetical protein
MFESPPEQSEIDFHNEQSRKMFFASRFKFLQAHLGLRPGCLHGLLAPSSMGKSTMARAIISDASEGCKVGIILSEETPIEYSAGFSVQKEPVDWSNIKFAIESNISAMYNTKEEQLDAIVSFAIENDIKIFFWDNITTGSILGDSVRPSDMSNLLDRLNKTVKTEQSHQFQGEDVRGSAQYYMKSDYFYTLQTKTKNDEKITFVKIAKHRYHQPKTDYYVLEFIVNRYTRDLPVPFSKIQEIFEKENKSEKKNKSY